MAGLGLRGTEEVEERRDTDRSAVRRHRAKGEAYAARRCFSSGRPHCATAGQPTSRSRRVTFHSDKVSGEHGWSRGTADSLHQSFSPLIGRSAAGHSGGQKGLFVLSSWFSNRQRM